MSLPHELHFTLRYRTNQIQAIVFGVGSVLILGFLQPPPLYQILYGVVLGFIVGLLYARMLRRNGHELIKAKRAADMIEVREKAQYGKMAQGVMFAGFLILAAWMLLDANQGGGLEVWHGMSFLAGSLATMSFRDFLCLPVYKELEALYARKSGQN
ncbi:MAG: hypothetical protein KDE09_07640 [Anaerolineales bacterium]|nr:hypothetical protein [Anaerolineales bacterium]MCB0007901.1 hypothetical protein [Anaerolineales bacterium]MCB0017647.1 hypothetical protein [Anaerolineales bacterium]